VQTQQEIPREFAIPSVEGNVNSAYTKTPEFKRTVQGRVGDIADYLIQPIQVRVAHAHTAHAALHTPHRTHRTTGGAFFSFFSRMTLCSAFLGTCCC
jgi:hypothetical protein